MIRWGTGRFVVSSGLPRWGLEQMCKLPFLTHGLISNTLDSESSKETTLRPEVDVTALGVTGALSDLGNNVLGQHSSWTPDSPAGRAGWYHKEPLVLLLPVTSWAFFILYVSRLLGLLLLHLKLVLYTYLRSEIIDSLLHIINCFIFYMFLDVRSAV